jgi:hypothetical protein
VNGPCGGFTPDFTKDNVTDFHVGGDTVLLLGAHPTITYLIRATTDQTAAGGWQPLLASDIQVVGLNLACNPSVPAPAAFAGSKGIIQVIADSPDGILFQCAAVNFVTGTGAGGNAHGCTNSTGVSISYANDNTLDGPYRAAGASASGSAAPSGASSTTSATGTAASTSATKSSAANGGFAVAGGQGSLGVVSWMVVVAAGTMAFRLL